MNKENNLIIIAAIGKNNELGENNKLIWKIKEDMEFFKKETTNHTVIIGRKTFESLPKVLPNRKNIVLTRNDIILPNEVIKFNSIQELLKYISITSDKFYVIGGGHIYKELLPYSNKLILTEIDSAYDNADTYFPKIEKSDWKEEIISTFQDNNPKYLRKVYTRKK